MDLFTDKLSQKTTAQDIIRANTAADIEELNRWKQQAAEQREYLLKMGKLVDQGLEKLSRSQEDTEILNGIARENAEGRKALQGQLEDLGQSMERLQEQVREAESAFSGGMDSVIRALEEKKEEPAREAVMEKLDLVDENVHKECVKVYRNVQAVVQEESTRLCEELKTSAKKSGDKARAAMVFAILAMLFALAGVVLQVLNILHVF